MRAANDTTLRVIADGLIHKAETRPKGSASARQLRDAAASLLDADMAIQREDAAFTIALMSDNDPSPLTKEDAA
ncbi:hypothetical protein [Brevundimonas sp.]|uniref:hypothetical protein n=1 Tax=Brevundimonas sp. TaxID=1871086 RepID=UPI002D2A50A8|nr:hypothetical protein [Brevundimonas sp.]HYC66659.1 hypothetical protein [Brevundimonas sp.]